MMLILAPRRTVPHVERFCTQNGSARRNIPHAQRIRTKNGPHAEWYMYLSIYTRLLFGFHFVPHAERFRTQNRFPFGLRSGLYSQLLANVATHSNGKSPIWVRSHLKMGTPHKWEKPNSSPAFAYRLVPPP